MTADYPTAAVGVRIKIKGGWNSYSLPASNFYFADEHHAGLGAAYPGYGDYHGFSFIIPAPPSASSYQICLEGQDSGVYNEVDCMWVTTPAAGTSQESRYTGGAYPHVDTTTTGLLYYRYFSNAKSGLSDSGVQSWNGASPGLTIARTLVAGGGHIAVTMEDIGTDVGRAISHYYWHSPAYGCNPLPHPQVVNCAFASSSVKYNLDWDTAPALSDNYRPKVAAHETGHALGLGHPPSPGAAVVMAQGAPGSPWYVASLPAAWDILNIQNLYR